MATAPLYRAKKTGRACPDRHRPISGSRHYCDRDRDRRRAITFLRQADLALEGITGSPGGSPAFVTARRHVLTALEELGA